MWAWIGKAKLARSPTRRGIEAIRVGRALGYQLEEILHLPRGT
jgi:hypothetical protein